MAYKTVRDGRLVPTISRDIVAGDIVQITKNQQFPADLVVLASSDEEGLCLIETANLDGESNLKRRIAPTETAHMDVAQLSELEAHVVCEAPNVKLYHFSGRLVLDSEEIALSERNFLQRGAQLRNTTEIYGLVVYSGPDTKMMKNLQTGVSKVSRLERRLNQTVLAMFGLKSIMLTISVILSAIYHSREFSEVPYLDDDYTSTPTSEHAGIHLLSYFILYTYMIPISLFVTVEVVRLVQAVYMAWDTLRMPGMVPRNSNANENLGMIQHIFSDKTGTFTKNQMILKSFAIGETIFDEEEHRGKSYDMAKGKMRDSVVDFIRVITLCNTAVPEIEDGVVSYQADSPDELALLDCAKDNGFALYKRKTTKVTVLEQDEEVSYELMATLEFTPERKRMSVVVRLQDGSLRLYCKGADSHVMPLCPKSDPMRGNMEDHTANFANEGLRTLVFAEGEVDEDYFKDWNKRFVKANGATVGRNEKIAELCKELESTVDLTIMGCTAVEDLLQDNVPETIAYFHEAGIPVWLLTGDKQETAISIGFSSRLLIKEYSLVIINAESHEHCVSLITERLNWYRRPENMETQFAIVIDGISLDFIVADTTSTLRADFIHLGALSQAVICCRSTPLQKALVVRLAKSELNLVTLAVGDGSNDVTMILEADVGVGINGLEGSQAARASDYAINEFKQLQPLICLHGRYCYKNFAYILCQFWYGFYSGFTAQVFYDEWLLSFFNIFFTSVPPFIYGVTEKDLHEHVILQRPEVYRRLQSQPLFNMRTYARWMFNSLYHSLIIFFGIYLSGIGSDVVRSDGSTSGMWSQAIMGSSVGVTVVTLRMALFANHWTIFSHVAIWGSIGAYFLFLVIYNLLFSFQPSMYYVFFENVPTTATFFIWLLLVCLCLLPDYTAKYVQWQYLPEDWQILREMDRAKLIPHLIDPDSIEMQDMSEKATV